MSEPDKYEKQAWEVWRSTRYTHADMIDVYAARLRADGAEIEKWHTLYNSCCDDLGASLRQHEATKQELSQLRAQLAALHGRIMNLPVKRPNLSSGKDYYAYGHRDARHADAALVAELCAGVGSADVKGDKEHE